MYDKTLVTDGLLDIEEALVHIIDRTSWIKIADDFATTPRGVDMLDVATIRLMAVGEENQENRQAYSRTIVHTIPKY